MLLPAARLALYLWLFSILILAIQLTACGQVRSHAVPVVDLGAASPESPRGLRHRVQAGDTLYAIAWRYNTRVEDLININKINNSGNIVAGQWLRLPAPVPRVGKTGAHLAQGTQNDTAASSRSTNSTRRSDSLSVPPHICCLENKSVNSDDSAKAGKSIKSISWSWPVRGRVVSGFMTNRGLNKGIDIQSKLGEPVLAASDGQVVYAGNGLRDYGNLIILKHANKYLSAYGNNQLLLVKEGQRVRVGQKIAEVGGSGQRVFLHFEIRYDGQPLNPLRQLPPL